MSQHLRTSLEDMDLDIPGAALPFSQRLARENGWSLAYTARVLKEYKRFLYLCSTSDVMLTPSDQVDQAWHLHLCYTDHYWNVLCQGILGKPLHHGPTRGGSQEHRKYVGCYEQTLAVYRDIYEADPPSDIWPSSAQRFAPQAFQRIDTRANFVLPKRSLTISVLALGATLLCASCVSIAAETSGIPEEMGIIVGVFLLLALLVSASVVKTSRRKRGRRKGDGNGGWFGGGCSSTGGCGGDSGGGGCGGGGCGGG
ncbi:MAG: hypothetical protein AAGJ31_05815 [Verrucomicrobiota bacterium]